MIRIRPVLLAVLLPTLALADGPQFSFFPDVHHRIRFEFDGRKDLADGDLNERFGQVVRLGGTFKYKDLVQVVARFQDVRVWGEETNTLGDFSGDSIDLHEGFVKVNPIVGDNFRLSFELGRRGWSYDDQRIIGRVGWTLQDRRFDGGRVLMGGKGWTADLFYAKTGETDSGVGHDTDVAGLHADYKLKTVKMALLALADLNDKTELTRFTAGVFVRGAPGIFRYRVEGYVQVGSLDDKDILAFFAGGEFGVAMKSGGVGWSVVGGADFLSGDDDPADNDIKAFNTLFATNHKFYGFMDFFLNVPLHTGGLGLLDAWGKIVVKPLSNLSIAAFFHHLRTHEKDANDDAALGNEIDLVVAWKPWKPFKLVVGGGIMLPSKALSTLKGGGDEIEPWMFVMTDVKF